MSMIVEASNRARRTWEDGSVELGSRARAERTRWISHTHELVDVEGSGRKTIRRHTVGHTQLVSDQLGHGRVDQAWAERSELGKEGGTNPARRATSFGILSDTSGFRNGRRGLLSPSNDGYDHSSGRRTPLDADDDSERRDEDEEDAEAGSTDELAHAEDDEPNDKRRARRGRRGEDM